MLALSLFCFGYWVVLLYAPQARVEVFLPFGHWKAMQIEVSDGVIAISDHYNSRLEIETAYRVLNPPAMSQIYWSYPGVVYRSLDWGGRLKWSVQCSLLLPALLSALIAAIFILGYLRVRREALRVFLMKARTSGVLGRHGPTNTT